jgi:hypothetical protein
MYIEPVLQRPPGTGSRRANGVSWIACPICRLSGALFSATLLTHFLQQSYDVQ